MSSTRGDLRQRCIARQVGHRQVGRQAVAQVDGDAVAGIGAHHQRLGRLAAGAQGGDIGGVHVHQRARVADAGTPVVDQRAAGQQVARGPDLEVVGARGRADRAAVEAQRRGGGVEQPAQQAAEQVAGALHQAGGQRLDQAGGQRAGQAVERVGIGVGAQDAPGAVPQRVGAAVVEQVVDLPGAAGDLGEQAEVHLHVLGDAQLLRGHVGRVGVGDLALPALAVQREDVLHLLRAVDQLELHPLALEGAQHRRVRVAVQTRAEQVGRVGARIGVQAGLVAVARQAQRQRLVLVVDEVGVVVAGRDRLGPGRRIDRAAVGGVEQREVGAGEQELAEVRVRGRILRTLDQRLGADTAGQRLAAAGVEPLRALGLDHQRVVEAVLLDRRRAEVVVREHRAQGAIAAVLVEQFVGPPALHAGLVADGRRLGQHGRRRRLRPFGAQRRFERRGVLGGRRELAIGQQAGRGDGQDGQGGVDADSHVVIRARGRVMGCP